MALVSEWMVEIRTGIKPMDTQSRHITTMTSKSYTISTCKSIIRLLIPRKWNFSWDCIINCIHKWLKKIRRKYGGKQKNIKKR